MIKPAIRTETKLIAIQMDAFDSIVLENDSTLLIALELQRRGYELFIYEPSGLQVVNGRVMAYGCSVVLHAPLTASNNDCIAVTEGISVALDTALLIMVRQNPPFDMQHITATYILDLLLDKVLVINNPTGIRSIPEKLSPFFFPGLVPGSLLTSSEKDILEFLQKHKKIVVKPLYQYGGRDVVLVRYTDERSVDIVRVLLQKFGYLLVQVFIPEVLAGDKRIILVDGEILMGYRRIPAKGDFRTNAAAGGSITSCELTPVDYDICKKLKPLLKKHGLFFVGIDIIGSNLIEINTTSPTGLTAINDLYNCNIELKVVDAIEAKVNDWYKELFSGLFQ